MAYTTAHHVAEAILAFSRKRGIQITNLKLQKLLYYCQAWHLAIVDKPLFADSIEAWIHGPVVPCVFREFKYRGWSAITFTGDEPVIDGGHANWPIDHHLSEVMEVYAGLSGTQLEDLTHQEDPWKLARNGIPNDTPSTNVISHESMIAYYRPKIRAGA